MSLIGLISDTHDREPAVQAAAEAFRREGVDDLIHGGDVTSPATLELLSGFHLWICRGNNDDPDELRRAAERMGAVFKETLDLTFAGKRFFVGHGHHQGPLLEAVNSGTYDYVVYGHSHRWDDRVQGNTRIVNPGALHRAAVHTIGILDIEKGKLRRVELPP